jgi:hypothetical protein
MKRVIIIPFILIISLSTLLADYRITRGPDIGEIYFIGPTVTGEGIYRSTDLGEIATCMDSTNEVESICADLTSGSLYCIRPWDCLYYSNNYGQQGSWVYRNSSTYDVNSGRNEGTLYNKIMSHSNDYGINFIQHLLNGYFGTTKATEIDNQDNVGYVITEANGIPDSLFLLISYDNFENLEIQHVFDMHWSHRLSLSRGTEMGELYLYKTTIYKEEKELWFSNDYGETWELKNTFYCPNLPIKGIVGGRQPGEVYMLVEYIQSMHFICHTYIYHSLDYGESFTIYHPIAIGPDPHFADFEATPTSGSAPLTVQFTDLSGGDPNWILGWEWDFDDDGEIDSYEQHPEYTYQDTGLYSVRLHILTGGGIGEEAYAYRKDYIHAIEGSGKDNYELGIVNYELKNYPNPFNPTTTISFNLTTEHTESTEIIIYNIKGQKIRQYSIFNNQSGYAGLKSSIVWDGTDNDNKPISSGIYLYKLNLPNSQVNKMLLLK